MARFVLVHGGWHGPWVWEPVSAELQKRGHEVVAPKLPMDETGASWQDCADKVVEALGRCASDTVLVGHSAGSIPVAIAASYETPRFVIYLTPSTPARDLPEDRPVRFKPAMERLIREDDQGRDYLDLEDAVRVFYARLDPSSAHWAASRLRPDADLGEIPIEGPPAVPSSFIYARHDEVFTSESMLWAARQIFGLEPIEIETGHTPQLETPADLAELMETLVGSR